MCYFNGTKVTKTEYIRLRHLEKLVANYKFPDRDVINGFDFGPTTILKPHADKKDFDLVEMEWGFIPDPMQWPFWETRQQVSKGRAGYRNDYGKWVEGLNFLNAVAEEVLAKNKVYRKAALDRRCLFLSSGFYEWRHHFPLNKRTKQPRTTPEKYPYRVGLKDRDYFFIAGIWQQWEDAETGEVVDTCALLTTAANLVMEQIHNTKKRQPTMLTDDLAWEWIFGDLDEQRIREIASFQIPWEDLSYYTLDRRFLNSTDPLKPFFHPELPPVITPDNDTGEVMSDAQLELF